MKLDDLPVPGEFWKAPVLKPRGDDDQRTVFAAVGQFLTSWEGLEHTFSFLFQRFVGGSFAAKLAYGSIVSNNGRRDALEAAAEGYFLMERPARAEMKPRLKRVMEHFKQAASRRNEIAHGVTASVTSEDKFMGYFVMPPSYTSKKRDAIPDPVKAAIDPLSVVGNYRYTSSDILDLNTRLEKLIEVVNEYAVHGWDWDIQFQMRNGGIQ